MEKEILTPTIISKIDTLDLPQSKAAMIKAAFVPMIQMLESFERDISELKASEVTPELCVQARAIRLKLVKIRTNTAAIHKEQKDEYIRGGKAIDGIKNILEFSVKGYENDLDKIENHFINLEIEKKQQLHEERLQLIKPFTDEPINHNLGEMTIDFWDIFFAGIKTNHEAKQKRKEEEEKARIENEKKVQLHIARKEQILPLWQFVAEQHREKDFSAYEETDWQKFVKVLNNAKLDFDKKQKEKELELKKLKAQQEKARKEREEQDKIETARHEVRKKQLAKMGFVDLNGTYSLPKIWSTYWEQVQSMSDENWVEYIKDINSAIVKHNELESLKKKQADDAQKEIERKQKEEADLIAQKKALKAPDKEKLKTFLSGIKMPDQPKLKDAESIIILQDIIEKHNKFITWASKEIEKI